MWLFIITKTHSIERLSMASQTRPRRDHERLESDSRKRHGFTRQGQYAFISSRTCPSTFSRVEPFDLQQGLGVTCGRNPSSKVQPTCGRGGFVCGASKAWRIHMLMEHPETSLSIYLRNDTLAEIYEAIHL